MPSFMTMWNKEMDCEITSEEWLKSFMFTHTFFLLYLTYSMLEIQQF